MTSTLPPLVQAVAGSIGSASANALTYPVDLATARLQLQSHRTSKRRPGGIQGGLLILQSAARKYGLSALYDGLMTDTGATVLANFFYFYFYSFLRDTWQKRHLKSSASSSKKLLLKLTIIEELFLGFLAGVASRTISTPLSIITLRLQTERSNDNGSEDSEEDSNDGIGSVVRKIYQEDGLAGFWKVFRRFLALSRRGAPNAVIDPTPREAFIGGAISNSIAKTRLQARRKKDNSSSSSQSHSLLSVLQDAYERNELYQGLEMQMFKGFVSQGVTLLVKGRQVTLYGSFVLLR
ncbi:hypothetical protein V5O48_011685 [Marasmius crinis-equi]|uniref:Uncharacterized protein n=1 Tax=Marasmius crinis-equi TaxID=585013 RepID=A0ABR3F4U0_9AGAR